MKPSPNRHRSGQAERRFRKSCLGGFTAEASLACGNATASETSADSPIC